MNVQENICCEFCETELKRQLIGSNVFYYCKDCGRITSVKDRVTITTDDRGAGICV
ncbi:hypothetical protein [Methanolobus sp. WCC4]|uniref:hypothetical protein n=1 Tax=Methanolobus sp. WCC4 TaxID=3125784 RepID=UPI0030F84AC5